MKRLGLLFVFLFGLFLFNINGVQADTSRDVIDSSTMLLIEENCDTIFGDPNKEGDFANFLQQIFNVFKYLAPALVIVLSIVEFIKAAASDDKDALMKAGKKTGVRIVLAIALFFIPGLINFLFDKLGWYGTCGIG